MRATHFLTSFLLLHSLFACSVVDATTEFAETYQAFEDATKKPAAKISHDSNWIIVSTTENDDRIYWFLAPDVNKTSPAVFKKTIHLNDKTDQKTVIVSECEAPKKICDDLMQQFKTLQIKYK